MIVFKLDRTNFGEANTTVEEVLFHFRGFCPDTLLEHRRYKLTQSTDDPNKVIFIIGEQSSRLEYDPSLSQWALSDPRLNLTAWTTASPKSLESTTGLYQATRTIVQRTNIMKSH